MNSWRVINGSGFLYEFLLHLHLWQTFDWRSWQMFFKKAGPFTGLRKPLKDLNDSKLIWYESKWFLWSSRINFIPFRIIFDSFSKNSVFFSDFKFRLSKEASNNTKISSLEMQWRKWRRVPLPVMYQSSDNHHLHSMGSNLPSKQVFMNKQTYEQILNI